MILERAVALVDVEIVGLGVVGDQQVHFAVVVHVHKNRCEAVIGAGIGHSGLDAHIGKRAVAVVVEQVVGLPLQPVRAAHHRYAVQLAERKRNRSIVGGRLMVQVVMDIAGDEQVEPPIAVVVAPMSRRLTSCPASRRPSPPRR